jgi:glutamate N-acetyltransferase/amino-acid N-acetyltransferase
VAAPAGLEREQVLPFSTGVIAEPLPVEPIAAAIPELMGLLDADNWLQAAQSIMTTDTLPKAVSEQCTVGGRTVNITGMAKGSGMIKPDMATMLAFVATDAEIAQPALEALLSQMVDSSFNSITVDGDTSTNDSCVLIATGASGAAVEAHDTDFNSALQSVFEQLAQAIIRDAEGATKFVEIRVDGAVNTADARSIGFTIAESPLVKTALFASDPNWGRLIMAIGRAPVSRLDPDRVDLYLGPLPLLLHGLPDPAYRETRGAEEMAREEICIRVDLNLGDASARIWTSDLSYEYVKINAEYRT